MPPNKSKLMSFSIAFGFCLVGATSATVRTAFNAQSAPRTGVHTNASRASAAVESATVTRPDPLQPDRPWSLDRSRNASPPIEAFDRGDLHVRGYAGNDKADHCAQLALEHGFRRPAKT
jgi:hypothetical protein